MEPPPSSLVTALQDRYRLERELGHGGMATVYLGYDLKHDRPVAVKVLRPELSHLLDHRTAIGVPRGAIPSWVDGMAPSALRR
jgi:hypothetical protein